MTRHLSRTRLPGAHRPRSGSAFELTRHAGLLVLLTAAVLSVGCSRSKQAPDATTTAPAATATAATPERTPAAGATATAAAALASGGDWSGSLAPLLDFVTQHGEPPQASFARVRIPALGVDVPVGNSLVGSDGQMTVPDNPIEVTWYDLQLWPGMGGRPGKGGNAIFSGHVNYAYKVPYADDTYYRGPAVFAGLAGLTPGDVIEVAYDGRVLRYVVTWSKHFPEAMADWTPVWSSDVAVDSITLYTCSGTFDSLTRGYSDRLVVRAERVS